MDIEDYQYFIISWEHFWTKGEGSIHRTRSAHKEERHYGTFDGARKKLQAISEDPTFIEGGVRSEDLFPEDPDFVWYSISKR